MTSRRGLLIGGAGLAIAAPALARPATFVALRNASYAIDGILPTDSWLMDDRSLAPAVRLTFPGGPPTAWCRYQLQCLRRTGGADAIEVTIWAPKGMRAVTRIPLDIFASV